LFDVDAQKSSRTTVRDWRSARPSALTIWTDDFFPNGGFVSTMSNRSPGSARSASSTRTGDHGDVPIALGHLGSVDGDPAAHLREVAYGHPIVEPNEGRIDGLVTPTAWRFTNST